MFRDGTIYDFIMNRNKKHNKLIVVNFYFHDNRECVSSSTERDCWETNNKRDSAKQHTYTPTSKTKRILINHWHLSYQQI